MTRPGIQGVCLAGSPDLPALVVGPSLGTSVTALWNAAAALMADRYHVIGWDLPGHGDSPVPAGTFSIAELADAVAELADREFLDAPVVYAGVSAAGAVGLQLLLDHPGRFSAAALICTAAKFGDPNQWRTRAQQVRDEGIAPMVAGAMQRWFAPGYLDRGSAAAEALIDSLRRTDAEGYAQTCVALGDYDVRTRLTEITTPVLAVAGADDLATPPSVLRDISDGVVDGRYVELPHTAHLAPAEQPGWIAELMVSLTERISRQ